MNQDEVLKIAAYSISAHNVQPFRLSFPEEGVIEIYVDSTRLLPVGDPHSKDLRQSLGALVETLSIALSQKNLEVKVLEHHEVMQANHLIARLRVQTTTSAADTLAPYLSQRFSYRGKFTKKANLESRVVVGAGFTLEFLTDEKDLKDVAELFDDVNYRFLTLPGYLEELYSWMRFTPSHAKWAKDGLNAESMSLSGVEAWGASVILKAKIFQLLAKIGLAKALVSETAQIRSASALAVILSDSATDFDKGRAFMRGWLTLTQQGLYGAPLSLLTDDKAALEKVAAKLSIEGKSIVNILRVGPLPEKFSRPQSARLNWQELKWQDAKRGR